MRLFAASSFLRAGQRGSGALEAALLASLMLLLMFVPLQIGLMFHARNVAAGAAQIAAISARGHNLGGSAESAARTYLEGNTMLRDVSVSVSRGQMVSVTVTGRSPSLVPGIPMPPVSQAAEVPVDQVTRP